MKELCFESLYNFNFLFPEVRYFYHDIRFDIMILNKLKQQAWSVRVLRIPLIGGFNLPEPGKEYSIVYKRTGPPMVRMTVAKRIGDNYFWLVFANYFNDLELIFFVVLKKTIAHL